MSWFKKNWISVLSAIIALLSGADLAAGVIQGNAVMNVSNIPAIGVGSASLITLLMRWVNTRTITTRLTTEALNEDVQRVIEAIFVVSENKDITDQMVEDLGAMAAAIVSAHGHDSRARELQE